ncbi:hypothetical protein D3C84_176670 [compost metagenome]
MTETIQKAESTIPRLRLGEMGTLGLKQVNGRIYEESRKELRYPFASQTFRLMAQDATVSAALSLFEMMVSQVDWVVDPGLNPTAEMQSKAQFLQECIGDMEHTWREFIKEVTSEFTYGYAVHEKVYRRRLHSTGSRYNDGRIGIKKLPGRSQDTLIEWMYSDDGRDLIGVKQSLAAIENGVRYSNLAASLMGTDIIIPRKKFLHFRVDPKRDNPEGQSPLRNCYFAWKYRTMIEEQEAVGVTRDMNGMPTLYIPPRYMSEDASDSEKAIYEYYKRIIRNIQNNEQSGMILPQAFDPESRQPLFKFELTSTQGSKMYDTDAIIRRWDNKILMTLFADMLKMGQDQVGSYSLAGAKTNIMSLAIESRLKEIEDVLNTDLVRQLFALNGHTLDEELPKLKYGELDRIDLEEFSSAVQRIFSVGGVEFDREVANRVRKALGVKEKPVDEPIDKESIPNSDSRAGDGMKTPGDGTSKKPGGSDSSVSNKAN